MSTSCFRRRFDALVAAKETLVDAVRAMRGRSIGRERITGPRSWPIRELPRWVAAFVVLVVLTDAVVLAVASSRVSIHAHDLGLFAGLLICSVATVELTRRVGENLGFVKDVYAVWELPRCYCRLPTCQFSRLSASPWLSGAYCAFRCTGACSARPPSG